MTAIINPHGAMNMYEGRSMHSNEVRSLISQNSENQKPMEARLTRIENDVAAVGKDMKAANEAIAGLKNSVMTLKAELRRDMAAMETRIFKWIFGTMVASMGTAIACAGLTQAFIKVP